MALCQYFLGNNMASSSHVTAANQSKSGPELTRLSLYTALQKVCARRILSFDVNSDRKWRQTPGN